MRRLLIATTALSVALSGMQPSVVLAQADTEQLCPNGKAPPCKRKKDAAQEGGQKAVPEAESKPRKKEKPADEGGAKPRKPAAEEAGKLKKEQPKKEQPQNEKPKKEKPQKDKTQKDKPQKEKVQPEKPAPKPVAPVEGGSPVKPRPIKPVKPEQEGAAQGGEQDQLRKDKKPAKDGQPAQDGKPAKEGKPVAPKKPLREPAPDAEVALQDIVAEPATGNGRPARKPAAALEEGGPAKAGGANSGGASDAGTRKERKKVTQEDVRSSSEEFGSRTTPRKPDVFRKPDEPQKPSVEKKGSGGLSDLEKAGLLVLGALAVGALLKNGDRVVSNTGDRVVLDRGNGQYVVLKDDDTLLRQPGTEVETESYVDGSTRTTIYRPDGSRVITVRDASGRVLQRVAVDPWGQETLLIDDLGREVRPIDVSRLPPAIPRSVSVSASSQNDALAAALARAQLGQLEGSYSLQQVRDYPQLRAYAPMVDVENIRFGTGLSAIDPAEAAKLQALGSFMADAIRSNPGEMFLIEGHTDAVGDAASNLALSDRRAESLALALTEYFGVPPENMVVQGYGEAELLVNTQGAEMQNRRTVVRMISGLLNGH